ncbi:MAG: GNAT family N-acetyltransferase [Chloroflexota bacterium]|nr:GNAT family N-acetyltransferase [Chloroflexota bacterium]
MQIRAAEPADSSEWLRMPSALWPGSREGEHAAEIDAFFRGLPEGSPPLAAVLVSPGAEGGLCGFLELSVRSYAEGCSGPAPYIEGWYVDRQVRGRGIGGALVQAAEQWARTQGYTEIASDTELKNQASQRAHQALGFEEVERTVHFRKAL